MIKLNAIKLILFLVITSCATSKNNNQSSEEEAMKKLLGAMSELTKVELTPIEKTEIPDELKKSLRNEPKVSGYKYKRTTIKGLKSKYQIPIPKGGSIQNNTSNMFVVKLNKKSSITCFVGDFFGTAMYNAMVTDNYKEYQDVKNFGESSKISIIKNTPMINLNSLVTYTEGNQNYVDYFNYAGFFDNTSETTFACFAFSAKNVLKDFVKKIIIKNFKQPKHTIHHLIKLDNNELGYMTTRIGFIKKNGKVASYTRSTQFTPLAVGQISATSTIDVSVEKTNGTIIKKVSKLNQNGQLTIKELNFLSENKYSFTTKLNDKVDKKEVTLEKPKGLYYEYKLFNKIKKLNINKLPKKIRASIFNASTFDGKMQVQEYKLLSKNSKEVSYQIEGTPLENYIVRINKNTGKINWSLDFPLPKVKMEFIPLN